MQKLRPVSEFHLIFTGPDRTGKTTLINSLLETLKKDSGYKDKYISLRKFSKPDTAIKARLEYMNYISNLFRNKYTIADRCFYDEEIYGPLYRGYMPNYINKLDREFSKLKNSIVIFTTASSIFVWKHWDGIEANGNELEDRVYISSAFDNLFNTLETKRIMINNSKLTKTEALNVLLSFLNKHFK